MKKCPICGGEIIENHETYRFEYKGEEFSYPDYIYYTCDSCEEDFEPENPEMDNAFIDFQRSVDDLLLPSDIKRIRKSFGLTQVEFAKRLGVGAKSFARYENGIVAQGRSMDNNLRILDKIPQAMAVVERKEIAEVKLPEIIKSYFSAEEQKRYITVAANIRSFVDSWIDLDRFVVLNSAFKALDKQIATERTFSVPVSQKFDDFGYDYDLTPPCSECVQ